MHSTQNQEAGTVILPQVLPIPTNNSIYRTKNDYVPTREKCAGGLVKGVDYDIEQG
jgi:hypothetical protein